MIKDYVALDIETTGLSPKKDSILEIGAVKVCEGMETEHFSSFVNSGIPVPEFITQLTGIDNEMARSGNPIREVMTDFLDFCGDSVILGHNVIFDFEFLQQNAVNMGREFPCMALDTLQLARKFLPDLPSRKLEALCSYYNIPQKRKHRAYDDARAASILYQRLVKEFGETNQAAFAPTRLCCTVRKESPITNSQKVYLNDLVKYHRIVLDASIESMTKSQASRMIDKIILQYGRIIKR